MEKGKIPPLLTQLSPFAKGGSGRIFLPDATTTRSGNLYAPTHLILFLNHLRLNRTWGTIGDHSFNAAVCSDYLEKLHFKRNLLEFDGDSLLKLFRGPFNLLQMNIPLLFT